jgi:hypothetical protein
VRDVLSLPTEASANISAVRRHLLRFRKRPFRNMCLFGRNATSTMLN